MRHRLAESYAVFVHSGALTNRTPTLQTIPNFFNL